MVKICITGGNGLLGSKIIAAARKKYRVLSIDLQEKPLYVTNNLDYVSADIMNRDRMYKIISDCSPDCVIHTAALTNVDECEKEKNRAWDINVTGTYNIVKVCRSLNCKLIHLSTDYVFDGKSGPYSETNATNPISVYGRTKLESERIVKKELKDYIIARTMVLYGYFPGVRQNFATWLIQKLSSGQQIKIVTDQYGTPTLADDIAIALLLMFKKNVRGIFNAAGSESGSRYKFAEAVIDVFNLDRSLLSPITTRELFQDALRPLNSGLKIDKITSETGAVFSSFRKGLMQIKEQMKRGDNFKNEIDFFKNI